MLPGPVAGALGCFGHIAVFVNAGIHEGHIAVVYFRLLVHDFEDALRAGQGHDDGVELLGNLVDGHVKVAGKLHKGHQAAQGQQHGAGFQSQAGYDRAVVYGDGAAYNGQDGILHIAKVIVDRAHHVGEFAGGEGVFAQRLVKLVELFLANFLAVKDLDHLLAGDHFLDVAVYRAQAFLLADEEFAGLARQDLGGKRHAYNGDHAHQRQYPGGAQHGDEQHDQGYGCRNGLGNGHGDHLTQCVDVAGVAGHDVAGGVGVKIPQRQGLHFSEQIIADLLLDALGHRDHQEALQEAGHNANQEDEAHLQQEFQNGAKILGATANHRKNVLVHQCAQHHGAAGLHQGVGEDAQQHHADVEFILQHIFQQPEKCLFGVLSLAAGTEISGMGRH